MTSPGARDWVFVAGRPFLPAADDPFSAGIGGTEQAVIHLTQALASKGHHVRVVGGTATARRLGAVDWLPAGTDYGETDRVVAINDARLLRGPRVVWFHNEVELGREFRRGRFPALLRYRPIAVFIGTDQARRASSLLPFRRRVVIPYGLSDAVLAAIPAKAPPPPTAIFTSQAYRGLREVMEMWQNDVAPHMPGARLEAYIAAADVPAFLAPVSAASGIHVGPRIGNDAILELLHRTRVLLAPGHRSETFCMAAAEAIAAGVPVITLGIGALAERVRDGIDGFICPDFSTMAARTRQLLTDDALWRRMQAAGIASRTGQSWSATAQTWSQLIPV